MSGRFGKSPWDGAGFLVADVIPRFAKQISIGALTSPLKSLYADALPVSVATGLVAAGSVIGDALALTAKYNVVATVAADTGVQLSSAIEVGDAQKVKNLGANALDVYPHAGTGVLDGESAGAPVVIAVGEEATFTRVSATNWAVSVGVAA